MRSPARCARTTTSSSWARTSPRWAARWASRRACSTSSAPSACATRRSPRWRSSVRASAPRWPACARSSRSCTRTSSRSRSSRSSTRRPSTATCRAARSRCRSTIRTQGGAGWSPGAQHAQQLEAWLVHVPGLKVAYPSTAEDVRGLLWTSIYDDNPVIFFEHRLLYPVKGNVPDEIEPIPLGKARTIREGTDVTVIAIGPLVHRSVEAAERAAEEGISVEVIDPRTLQPLDEPALVESVKKTNRAVVAHEAVTRMGFGAEVTAVLQHQAFDYLDAPIERVGAKFAPLAFAPVMEQFVVPKRTTSLAAIRRTVGKSNGERGQAPAPRSRHGSRDGQQVAEVGGRHGREGRAALRGGHRQGHAGGRVRLRRRAAEDRAPVRRGARRPDDRLHR